jgi:hypothetical protein
MPNGHPIILPMQFGDPLSIFAATCPIFHSFDCDDNFIAFIGCGL